MSVTHYKCSDGESWYTTCTKDNKDTLPAGYYEICEDDWGKIFLKLKNISSDEIVSVPNESREKVLEITRNFLKNEYKESLKTLGMLNKLSVLLWGEPGTSKTVTITTLIEYATEQNCVIINGHDVRTLKGVINDIREIEPERVIVVIWEEFDKLLDYSEEALLQLLDGSDQLPNVLYLMTTNYIDRLPARIIERCRRISFQVRFDFPSAEERMVFFQKKIPSQYIMSKKTLETWVNESEGFSLDQCSQLILSVFGFRQTLEDSLKDIRARKNLKSQGEEELERETEDEVFGDNEMPILSPPYPPAILIKP